MKQLAPFIAVVILSVNGSAQLFSEIIKTVAFDRETEDRFGYAVDISGNFAIIGAYADAFGALNPNMSSLFIQILQQD